MPRIETFLIHKYHCSYSLDLYFVMQMYKTDLTNTIFYLIISKQSKSNPKYLCETIF